jgi:hypothetical protein
MLTSGGGGASSSPRPPELPPYLEKYRGWFLTYVRASPSDEDEEEEPECHWQLPRTYRRANKNAGSDVGRHEALQHEALVKTFKALIMNELSLCRNLYDALGRLDIPLKLFMGTLIGRIKRNDTESESLFQALLRLNALSAKVRVQLGINKADKSKPGCMEILRDAATWLIQFQETNALEEQKRCVELAMIAHHVFTTRFDAFYACFIDGGTDAQFTPMISYITGTELQTASVSRPEDAFEAHLKKDILIRRNYEKAQKEFTEGCAPLLNKLRPIINLTQSFAQFIPLVTKAWYDYHHGQMSVSRAAASPSHAPASSPAQAASAPASPARQHHTSRPPSRAGSSGNSGGGAPPSSPDRAVAAPASPARHHPSRAGSSSSGAAASPPRAPPPPDQYASSSMAPYIAQGNAAADDSLFSAALVGQGGGDASGDEELNDLLGSGSRDLWGSPLGPSAAPAPAHYDNTGGVLPPLSLSRASSSTFSKHHAGVGRHDDASMDAHGQGGGGASAHHRHGSPAKPMTPVDDNDGEEDGAPLPLLQMRHAVKASEHIADKAGKAAIEAREAASIARRLADEGVEAIERGDAPAADAKIREAGEMLEQVKKAKDSAEEAADAIADQFQNAQSASVSAITQPGPFTDDEYEKSLGHLEGLQRYVRVHKVATAKMYADASANIAEAAAFVNNRHAAATRRARSPEANAVRSTENAERFAHASNAAADVATIASAAAEEALGLLSASVEHGDLSTATEARMDVQTFTSMAAVAAQQTGDMALATSAAASAAEEHLADVPSSPATDELRSDATRAAAQADEAMAVATTAEAHTHTLNVQAAEVAAALPETRSSRLRGGGGGGGHASSSANAPSTKRRTPEEINAAKEDAKRQKAEREAERLRKADVKVQTAAAEKARKAAEKARKAAEKAQEAAEKRKVDDARNAAYLQERAKNTGSMPTRRSARLNDLSTKDAALLADVEAMQQ